MGIRGLTSYISQNSSKFYVPLKLHDCTLVIDGCSLACQLYLQASDCNSVFGGDYDRYAQKLEDFFSVLEQCNVTPVVVVDGGYEGRKLQTIFSRYKEKLCAAKICNPANQKSTVVFPLLIMEAFKQTLFKLNVKFVQTDFEADQEIAAIARLLKSPVLSNDSDFYIFNVMYIPFQTLNLSPFKMEQDHNVKYYLGCKVYTVERFVSNFGGFDSCLLPLISILLGNDYVSPSVFKKFIEKIMLPKAKKTSLQHQKLTSIFEWLQNETLESATAKMLEQLKRRQRTFVKQQIQLVISANKCLSSEFTSYLGLEKVKLEMSAAPQCDEDNLVSMLKSAEIVSETSEGSGDDSEGDGTDSEEEGDFQEETGSHEANSPTSLFPPWLREKFRKGELSTCVSDIFHMHLYFCHPQVEDFSCSDAQSLGFPILKIIFGVLRHGTKSVPSENDDCTLTCYTRGAKASCQIVELPPTRELPGCSCLPSISNLPGLSISEKKKLFFSSLGIADIKDIDVLESFSECWKLFASAVVFWARSTALSGAAYHHLHSLIICIIALGVVDKRVGRIRHQKDVNSIKNKNSESSDLKGQQHVNIPETECLSLAESLIQFHQFHIKQFSRQIVHLFAQFQACLNMVMALNSLLEFPFPQCQLSETFSGTLAYAACVNLKMKKDVGAYINTLMSRAPSLYEMYKCILDKFMNLLPGQLETCKKAHQKTKKKNFRQTSNSSSSRNKFALLGDV